MKSDYIPVQQWSTMDTLAWMKRQHVLLYDKYKENFLTHNVDGRTTLLLTESDVRNIGVHDVDDRKLMMRLFNLLRLRNTKEELGEKVSNSSNKSRFSGFVNV